MSAAAAMSAIVTCSKPRSSNSAIACLTICSRVRCFLRARCPSSTSPMPPTVPVASELVASGALLQPLYFCTHCVITTGMALLLGRLAGAAAHHWKRSLLLVLVALVALAGLASAGGGFTDDFGTPGTESQQAYDLLSERFPAQSGDTATIVFSVQDGTLRDGDRPTAIAQAVDAIAGQPHVTGVPDPLASRDQVSRDGRIAFTTVQYDQPAMDLGKAPGEALETASEITQRAGIETDRNGQI